MVLSGAKSALSSIAQKQENVVQKILFVIIFVGFTVLENVVEETFRCPCPDYTDEEGKTAYFAEKRKVSGCLIGISTTIIFIFTLVFVTTSRCYFSKEREDDKDVCVLNHGFSWKDTRWNLVKALIATIAWLLVLVIDGDYIACARTDRPYTNITCDTHQTLPRAPYSAEYRRVKKISQIVGLSIAGAVAVIGVICLLINFKENVLICCKCRRNYKIELKGEGKSIMQVAKEMGPVYFMEMKKPGNEIKDLIVMKLGANDGGNNLSYAVVQQNTTGVSDAESGQPGEPM